MLSRPRGPRLLDDDWIPKKIFSRLADPLFFHLDESFGDEASRNMGKVALTKVLSVTQLLGSGESDIGKLPVRRISLKAYAPAEAWIDSIRYGPPYSGPSGPAKG